MKPTDQRIATAQQIVEGYSYARSALTKEEQSVFDKVVPIIEEISELPPSSKLLALDCALVMGLFAVRGTPKTLAIAIKALTSLAMHITIETITGEHDGRSHSN